MTRARFPSIVGLRLRAFGDQPPSEKGGASATQPSATLSAALQELRPVYTRGFSVAEQPEGNLRVTLAPDYDADCCFGCRRDARRQRQLLKRLPCKQGFMLTWHRQVRQSLSLTNGAVHPGPAGAVLYLPIPDPPPPIAIRSCQPGIVMFRRRHTFEECRRRIVGENSRAKLADKDFRR